MEIAWRAPFRSSEVNALHAACFETRLYSDDEWDWNRLCERHSLGWASARTDDVLVGFANVLWDGFTHAWLQDVMVSPAVRRAGVGTRLVQLARDQRRRSRLRVVARRLRGAPTALLPGSLRLHGGRSRADPPGRGAGLSGLQPAPVRLRVPGWFGGIGSANECRSGIVAVT